jgi:hypothetical protein
MPASIRGHQGQFKIFENGALVNIVNLTSVDIKQDSTFSRAYYVGAAQPEGDQSCEGFSGSVEAEVKDEEIDNFIDALINNNLNGIGVSEYTFMSTENYGDGRTASWVYFDVQWKMSRKQGGLNEKVTKTLEFQASGRLKV